MRIFYAIRSSIGTVVLFDMGIDTTLQVIFERIWLNSQQYIRHQAPHPINPYLKCQGLGCGCIQLNEAAVQELMPGNLWGFHWGGSSDARFSLWQIQDSALKISIIYHAFAIKFCKFVLMDCFGHCRPLPGRDVFGLMTFLGFCQQITGLWWCTGCWSSDIGSEHFRWQGGMGAVPFERLPCASVKRHWRQ